MQKQAFTFLLLIPVFLMGQSDKKITEVFLQSFVDAFNKVEVSGCDVFTFKDGKIAIKNPYRKNRLEKMKN